MMGGRLRPAEVMIGIGSLALLVSTLLPLYSLPSVAELASRVSGSRLVGAASDSSVDLNIWDLPVIRWWVYLSILLGVCLVAAALLSETAGIATILLTPLLIFSGFAVVGLVYRLLVEPRAAAEAQPGLYLAFAATCLVFAGVCWGLRDESIPAGFRKAPAPELIEVD